MRALLSVWDKTGLDDLARGLHDLGWELVASGGTASALVDAGLPVTAVEDVTGSPEMLDGRVKTLHPAIAGGILADRSKPSHLADLEAHGIGAIDLVVCNLYPFVARPGIETIDVGGPTMVRAAAKNHAHVAVVVDPADYGPVLDELRAAGALPAATRRRLARAAFAHTAAYDAAIATWLTPAPTHEEPLPPTLHLALERAGELRYGENPHQAGARYRAMGRPDDFWSSVRQLGGMELSYLNVVDADAAWRLAHDLAAGLGDRPVATIIKHANPCGVAVADAVAVAYERAFECDPMSAFGGIVALTRAVDEELAAEMAANPKADVVIAPQWSDGAVALLAAKRKNTRLLAAPAPPAEGLHLRPVGDGWLVQQPYRFGAGRDAWQVVSKARPTPDQWVDLELAWRVCAHVKSNAIVLAADGMAVGIGAGQQNRVDPGEIAVRKAAGRAKGGACASDAFFPFRDGLDAVAAAGVAAVIEPGGSVRDAEVIAAADEHGIALVFTGERQFRH
ncbi:MAG: bifunctional phosphoribosylaminoimidazolecarboxamide formyltransferase/IMP cyclohydrolase [Actinomycetota bacterium]